MVGAETRDRPVTALLGWGWRKRLPIRRERAKLANNNPNPMTGALALLRVSLPPPPPVEPVLEYIVFRDLVLVLRDLAFENPVFDDLTPMTGCPN
jgi:hypothetical protein